MPTKELHLAKNIEELQKKSELPNFDSQKYDWNRLAKLCHQLKDGAKEAMKNGDEERAYIMFYRFLTATGHINEKSKEDKIRFRERVKHSDTEFCLNAFDKIQKALSKRYNDRNQEYEDRKNKLFNNANNTSTPLPGTSVKVDTSQMNGFEPEEEKEDEYATITPMQLVESIQKRSSQLSKVLIIDIRSAEENAESAIAANKLQVNGEVNVINIPSDLIGPGLTFSNLSRKVSLGLVKDALERRRSMDTIVIMDRATCDFESDSKCVLLAQALFKWDQSPECVKKKPVLLKGGFQNFAITYPILLTNSEIINQFANSSPSPRLKPIQSGMYNFFEESNAEEEKKKLLSSDGSSNEKPIPTTLNGFINGNQTNGSFTSNSSNNTTISTKSFGLTVKVPGIAKPIIPDRAAKPNLTPHNNLNDDSNEVAMKDGENDKDLTPLSKPLTSSDFRQNPPATDVINTANRSLNDPPISRSSLPPKPGHLISSLSTGTTTNGHSSENGSSIRGNMEIDDDDDDFVAGRFDDDLTNSRKKPVASINNVLQTPVHRRGEVNANLTDENMSEEDEEMEVIGGGPRTGPSLNIRPSSKPISMTRSINRAPNNNFSAPGSLSRSLSSPNIAQFDESQQFSFGSAGIGTPKIHPIVDRSMKPGPIQALLRKTRDFSPQYSSYGRIPGLKNLGNTCFMNSVLQCLNNTFALAEYLRRERVHINPVSKFGSNGELAVELMELFKQMVYPSNFKHISPKDLNSAVKRHIPDFGDNRQQDAHEFLVCFLHRLHADMNTRADVVVEDPVQKDPNYYDSLTNNMAAHRFWTMHVKRNSSIISELFDGLSVNTTSCLHCNYTSRTLEAFTCLTLPIQEGVSRTSINTSLKMHLRQERVSDEPSWKCMMCNQKRDAERCTYIWRLPKILVIQLKRFSYEGMWRQKVSTFVDFPIDNLLIESHGPGNELHSSYSLYGVVNHSGQLEGGHYIAYSRNIEMNITWHKYDDQEVTPVADSEVITQNAYVLFYKQTSKS